MIDESFIKYHERGFIFYMKHLKKLLAGILAAAISTTSLAPAFAESNYEDSSDTGSYETNYNDNIELSASNSLGKYLKSKQDPESYNKETEIKPCSVDHFSFSEESGIIQVLSSQETECTLKVTIYTDDAGRKTVTELTQSVSAGKEVYTEISVDTNILPQYYVTEAVLIGLLDKEVSEVYTDTSHTETVLNVQKADINDFPDNQVLNLDDDTDNNFIVLSDDTILAESDDTHNILLSADYDKGVFVFKNATSEITDLKKNDFFCIQPNDTDIIAINVASSETVDGITTVKESGKDIDDMFSFVKIETASGMGPSVARSVSADTDSVYEKILADLKRTVPVLDITVEASFSNEDDRNKTESEFKVTHGAFTIPPSNPDKFEVSMDNFEAEIERVTTTAATTATTTAATTAATTSATTASTTSATTTSSSDNSNGSNKSKTYAEAAFRIGIKSEINYKISFYKSFDINAIATGGCKSGADIYFNPVTTISAEFEGAIKKEDIHLSKILHMPSAITFPSPLPGLTFTFDPTLDFEAKGSAKAVLKLETVIEGKFDTVNKPYLKQVQAEPIFPVLELEAEISVSVNVLPSATLVTKKFADIQIVLAPVLTLSTNATLHPTVPPKILSYDLVDIESASLNDRVFLISADHGEYPEKQHLCQRFCIAVTAGISWKLGLEFTLLGYKFSPEVTFPPKTPWNCYFSEKGIGLNALCPNDVYRAIVNVTLDGKPAENASVKIDGLVLTTNAKGQTVFYCRKDPNKDTAYSASVYLSNSIIKPENITFSITEEDDGKGNKQIKCPIVNVVFYTPTQGTITNNSTDNSDSQDNDDSPENNTVDIQYDTVKQSVAEVFPKEGISSVDGKPDVFPTVLTCGQLAKDIYYSITRNAGSDETEMQIWGHGSMDIDDEIYANNVKLTSTSARQRIINYNVTNVSIYNDVYIKTEIAGKDADGNDIYVITDIEENPITSIGDNLFSGYLSANSSIKKITIPNTIERIGIKTFAVSCTTLSDIEVRTLDKAKSIKENKLIYNTGGLETTNLKEIGSNAFYECNKLPTQIFPESLESIGSNAFYNCDFNSLYLPDSVTYIGDMAFAYNTNMKTARISKQIRERHTYADAYPDSKIQIGYGVFCGCENLTKLDTPDIAFLQSNFCSDGLQILWHNNGKSEGLNLKELNILETDDLTELSGKLCYEISTLEKITIPDCVEKIGESCFAGCTRLKSITLPKNLKTIEKNAFERSNLSNGISFPKELTTIEYSAFKESGLTSVTFNDSLKGIGSYAFQSCKSLKKVHVPDSVTSLGKEIFRDCTNLVDAYIGPGLTHDNVVQNSIFIKCDNLKKLSMYPIKGYSTSAFNEFFFLNPSSNSVISLIFNGSPTTIYSNTLGISKKLKEVYIPSSVTKIEANTFKGITNLETVYYDGTDEQWDAIEILSGNDPLLKAKRQHSYGNLNDDGKTDLTDLTLLSLYLMKSKTFTDAQLRAADIDGNGTVDIADLARFKQFICHDVAVPYIYLKDPGYFDPDHPEKYPDLI